MKRPISITLPILSMLLGLGLLGLWLPPASIAGVPPPDLQGEAALNHLKEQGRTGWPTIDPAFTQQRKLIASDGEANDFFGDSAPISGETIVAGAPYDEDAAGANQGSAYAFARSGGIWSRRQRLIASGPTEMAFTRAIALGHGSLPFIVALQGHANPTPTENPCVLVNTEEATGSALGIGPIAWASREVVSLCSNAEGAEVEGEFTITAASGDKMFGVYQTLAQLNSESNEITARGRYRIVGGTGRFDGASGEGAIGAAGSLLPPFEFRGVLIGRVSF